MGTKVMCGNTTCKNNSAPFGNGKDGMCFLNNIRLKYVNNNPSGVMLEEDEDKFIEALSCNQFISDPSKPMLPKKEHGVEDVG